MIAHSSCRYLGLIFVGIIAVIAAPLPAAMMNHGDFMSDNYTFVDVTEDNLEESLFYGSISTGGDTLIVDPDGFGVQVDPGPGAILLDSELEMMIVPKGDASVDQIGFNEEGDYTITGDGVVEAAVSYFWQIMEVDDTPVTPITGQGSEGFSASTAITGEIWSIGFNIDLAAELAAAEADAGQEIGDRITKVNFRFDNTLTANAMDALSIAFIQKKSDITIMVPEPATFLSLLLMGSALLARFRRR